jgi:predicted nucleic acid-binding protein
VSGYLLDASAAVPLLMERHDAHAVVASAVGDRPLCLAGLSLAETYSVLTRLPGDSRLEIDDAITLIDTRIETVLPLSESVQRTLHRRLRDVGVSGGAVWDGIIALTAVEHGMTLLSRDARAWRVYAALGATFASPGL